MPALKIGAPRGPQAPLKPSRDDMKNVPVLGSAARRDAVGLLFLEHLQVEARQQRQRLLAADEGHARPPDPAVTRSVPLATEPATVLQRLADAPPQAAKRCRVAKRHGEARIDQAEATRQRHIL